MSKHFPWVCQLLILALLCAPTGAKANNIVVNGSFENGAFVNTLCNYMLLGPGATAMTGWTVVNTVAWGISPCDGFAGSNGNGFVDLSSFGATSPNGAIQQLLNTTLGTTYTFSIDNGGGGISVMAGANTLALSPGSPFIITGVSWATFTGTFTATSLSTLLTISNAAPGNPIVFIDNVSASPLTTATPEPSSLLLLSSGLAAGFLRLCRRVPAPR